MESKAIFPKKLRILNTIWKIKLHKKDNKKLGWTDNTERTINIVLEEKSSIERINETFYHELTHAVLYSFGASENEKHEFVIPLSNAIREVFTQLNKIHSQLDFSGLANQKRKRR